MELVTYVVSSSVNKARSIKISVIFRVNLSCNFPYFRSYFIPRSCVSWIPIMLYLCRKQPKIDQPIKAAFERDLKA
jgi:hypothetical protein